MFKPSIGYGGFLGAGQLPGAHADNLMACLARGVGMVADIVRVQGIDRFHIFIVEPRVPIFR